MRHKCVEVKADTKINIHTVTCSCEISAFALKNNNISFLFS